MASKNISIPESVYLKLREGTPLGIADCMIGAIALEHDETLVTRDGDFERIPDLRLRMY